MSTSYHHNCQTLVAVLTLAVLLLMPRVGQARVTDYTQEPAAFSRSSTDLLWDTEFAANLGDKGQQYVILDFCHSGGFVDDLGLSNRYVAASALWHEYGWAQPAGVGLLYSSSFWDSIEAGSTVSAANNVASAAVSQNQTAYWRDPGALGTNTLAYSAGDKAYLLGASTNPYLGADNSINNARDALLANGWSAEAITTKYGSITQDDLASLYADSHNSTMNGNKIVVYLADHGASTDVIKSRETAGRYDYQIVTSLYRDTSVAGDTAYGIWSVLTECPENDFPDFATKANDKYWNITPPKPSWEWRLKNKDGKWFVEWYSPEPANPDTWLECATEYSFGFNSYAQSIHVQWEDQVWLNGTVGWDPNTVNDRGWPNSPDDDLGTGAFVYEMPTCPHEDPSIWPGWENGGDGWVLWPVPEPGTLALLGIVAMMLLQRRRTG